MKRIILSRKGFDSKYGGKPSPIFKDNRIFSIPIPQNLESPSRYKDLQFNGISGSDALKESSVKKITENDYCHHDPALNQKIGIFGQASSSQTELKNCGVGIGDLFLFFGWFKQFSLNGRDILHIFGWLQVSKILSGEELIKNFLKNNDIQHPHGYGNTSKYRNNTIYVGTKNLIIDQKRLNLRGFGLFKESAPDLILSSSKHTRSMWKLPKEYFYDSLKEENGLFLNRINWTDKANYLVNTNKGPGQEFVLNSEKNPKVMKWALDLIRKHG